MTKIDVWMKMCMGGPARRLSTRKNVEKKQGKVEKIKFSDKWSDLVKKPVYRVDALC